MDITEKNICLKYFHGDCSEEEIASLRRWIHESDENKEEFFKMEELYLLGKYKPADEQMVAAAEEKLFAAISRRNVKKKIWAFNDYLKIAATLVGVLLLGGMAYMFMEGNKEDFVTLNTGDEVRHLVLADGTSVWINSYSSISYPKTFKRKIRKVKIDGEGYFDVAPDKEHPFVVMTESMKVRVLGTEFNIYSRKNSELSSLSLLRGEVAVEGMNNEGSVCLTPGQKVLINHRAGKMRIVPIGHGRDYWPKNELIFENATVPEIMDIIASTYKVVIRLSNHIDVNRTYSGIIKKKKSVVEVLQLLSHSIPVSYKVHDNLIEIYPQ